LFELNTSVVRFGIESAKFGCICVIRFRARSKVESLGDSGKFEREAMSLSVKSMASCGPATARFSMVGILCPTWLEEKISMELFQSVVSALFIRTSKVKLALFEWI
jgi:hypothetical protein